MKTKHLVPLALVGAATLSLAACGDDEDEASDTTATPATAAAPASSAAPATSAGSDTTMAMDATTVAVEGVDYAFENLPESVPAGTLLEFTNGSDVEFHELVAIRIPDEETRPVAELIQLPEEEIGAIMGSAEPATVIVAPPGEAGMPVLGDGTLAEAGRYVVLCSIPVGADPDAVAAAMQSETGGPSDLGDGPPHFTEGMVAELVVEPA